MRKSSNKIRSKQFLNLDGHHSTAAIYTKVSEWGYDITISDCNRQIQLTNSTETIKERENALHKLNVLKTEIVKAEKYILEQSKLFFNENSADSKKSFKTIETAQKFIIDLGGIKTLMPKDSDGLEIQGLEFYQKEKNQSYALIIKNNKAKVLKFKILFFE